MAETSSIRASLPKALSLDLRKLLAFGAGVGIQITANDLEIAAARVRPSRIQVLGRLTIENYASRPAAEWGAEYARFLKSNGLQHVSATVLLPRREVIARPVSLPGVATGDMENAIRFDLDSMHPYGDQEICWGWAPLSKGAALVGVARKSVIDHYVGLFAEAGINVASLTFSAAAIHAAIRLNGHQEGRGFVALSRTLSGSIEVYGESAARPVFSAEFDLAPQRATTLALAELRLPPDTAPEQLEEVLPKPAVNPIENDLARNALPYATALAGACPRLAPSVNVLPREYRKLNSRAMLIPSIALAAIVVLLVGGFWVYSLYADRKYLGALQAEIAKIQPRAERAARLDRQFDHAQAQVKLLDQYRGQTRADLDTLNEITKLLPSPIWTHDLDLQRDTVRMSGEAEQTAGLVKILDSSSLFENTAVDSENQNQRGSGELFQIHTSRRKR
jgi:Tfp pilus assembly protein PilN